MGDEFDFRFRNPIKDVQTFEGGGVPKTLDNVQSFALFFEAFPNMIYIYKVVHQCMCVCI